MCIKLCLTLFIPIFQFTYQEAEAIPSDTGRDCLCIAFSEEILDGNIMINLVLSAVRFSQVFPGQYEDLQFFQALDCLS